jgi:hypothetical protein
MKSGQSALVVQLRRWSRVVAQRLVVVTLDERCSTLDRPISWSRPARARGAGAAHRRRSAPEPPCGGEWSRGSHLTAMAEWQRWHMEGHPLNLVESQNRPACAHTSRRGLPLVENTTQVDREHRRLAASLCATLALPRQDHTSISTGTRGVALLTNSRSAAARWVNLTEPAPS